MAGFFLFLLFVFGIDAYVLEQVVVLGRHNIRTPLTANLESVTSKIWPKWNEETGYLTPKGALLEGYMGEYFSLWLKKEGLLSEECPNKDSVFIYANALQRTKESARMFSKAAFNNCNVTVHYKENVERDPVFQPVIHNTSDAFKEIVYNEMQNKLHELDLKEAYLELNRVTDLKNSKICKSDSICDFVEKEDEIYYEIGEEPNVKGPLALTNSIVDSFLMQFYNGVPLNNIAWGETNPEKFKLLSKITKENQNVRFNSTELARDVAKPLLNYIYDVFSNKKPKFTLLVGHDSNINSVIAAMGFKPYNLPNQYEKTPVGGKLVFQKWYDEELNRHLLKILYVYQSMDQLRNGTKLSLENPPYSVVMELRNCNIDVQGYCLWKDFIPM